MLLKTSFLNVIIYIYFFIFYFFTIFQFEAEIQKVHEAYESLVKSSQKRERLEAALKMKLEEEVRKLRLHNEELKGMGPYYHSMFLECISGMVVLSLNACELWLPWMKDLLL